MSEQPNHSPQLDHVALDASPDWVNHLTEAYSVLKTENEQIKELDNFAEQFHHDDGIDLHMSKLPRRILQPTAFVAIEKEVISLTPEQELLQMGLQLERMRQEYRNGSDYTLAS